MHYRQLLSAIASAHTQSVGRATAAVNQGLVLRNWLVGAYVVEFEQGGEDRAKYGAGLLVRLSRDLKRKGVPGLSADVLERTRSFYLSYPQIGEKISATLSRKLPAPGAKLALEISSSPMTESEGNSQRTATPKISATLSRKLKPTLLPTPLSAEKLLLLSWSHLVEIIRLEDPWKRAFYENECLLGAWSVRQLQRQIGSLLYERTGLSKNKRAVVARARRQSADAPATIEDLIRDPYVLEFTGLADRPAYSENELETALLNHVQGFLLELGTGFCFEARQFRITVGNEHDRIDLVFYHRRLRCHVLVDLKVRAFTHGDAGQMNFYLNYFKKHMMNPGDQPPVGILLCSDKDKTKVEYATAGLSHKLFVSRYLVALPSAEQLRRFVASDRARIEQATPRT